MLIHYIKVALRNLRKYPTQTAISVLGLAAGFVCLSLSALWMRYENTYDTMHEDYERIYAFQDPYFTRVRGLDWSTRLLVSGSLVNELRSLPDIESVTYCRMMTADLGIYMNGIPVCPIETDSTWLSVFDIPLVEGGYSFLINEHEVAITESLAARLFLDGRSCLGEKVVMKNRDMTVTAVIRDCQAHSIFDYDVMMKRTEPVDQEYQLTVFAKTHPGILVDSLAGKVASLKDGYMLDGNTKMIPLTESHRDGGSFLSLTYAHLQSFSLCSVLMVACALINFLVLYLIRLRGRQREMALRIVNGATSWGLMKMLLVEFSIVLFGAFAFGALFTEWLQEPFVRFASIDMPYGFVLGKACIYMTVIAVLCLLFSVLPIMMVRQRTLQSSIGSGNKGNIFFRKVSIFVQLAVSMTFVFCTFVMLRQVMYLRNTDWGFRIENRAILNLGYIDRYHDTSVPENEAGHVLNKIAEIAPHVCRLPMVTDVTEQANDFAHRMGGAASVQIAESTEQEATGATFVFGFWDIGNPHFGFTVLEGTLPREADWKYNEIVITDNLRRQLGWDTAVGRTLYWRKWNENYELCTVVAVIKDIYEGMMSREAYPIAFRPRSYVLCAYPDALEGEAWAVPTSIVMSYQPDMREELTVSIETLMERHFPEIVYELIYPEDVLANKMKSETNLMLILSIITAVCILVAVFGVYSIVTLACAQRRKEIALRKIHGATLTDILSIFIKEYGLIVLAASAVAFPIGYMIMKEWVAQYVKQAPIAWWIYAVILLGVVLLIALSVGSRVWRTARENPAEVIKRGN